MRRRICLEVGPGVWGHPGGNASDEGGLNVLGSVNPGEWGCLGSYAKEGCLGASITYGLGGLQTPRAPSGPGARGMVKGAAP